MGEVTHMTVDDICNIIYHDGMFGESYYVQCVQKDSDVELLNERFSRSHPDYLFLGWAIEDGSEDIRYHNRDMMRVGSNCPYHLYAVWKKKTGKKDEETEEICVVGYDPLPVLFHDMSKVRSLSTTKWWWDFGDSIYYCVDTSTTPTGSEFMLPGDNDQKIKNLTSAVTNSLMWPSAASSYYSPNENEIHYTGMSFESSSTSANGTVETTATPYPAYPNSRQKRYTREVSGAKVVGITVDPDQCGRVNCGEETDFGNDILHVYKGPGMYYATMWCESASGLQSMRADDSTFDENISASEKKQVYGCWIHVLPTCPCTKPAIVSVSGVSSAYSADSVDEPDVSAGDGYIKTIGNGTNTTYIGYAPYVYVVASGSVIPRSLPVTGAWMDWHDWGIDFVGPGAGNDCLGDHASFGYPNAGWPTWGAPSTGHEISSRGHAYTLPGVYSIGIYPEFADSKIHAYLPTVTDYEHCSDDSDEAGALKNKIIVLEIPPKFDATEPITCTEVSTSGYPSYVESVQCHVSAGSYKIARVDWDFGDGSEIISISIDGTSATDYGTETTTVEWPTSGRVTSGYMTGNPSADCSASMDGEYLRYDPRDWVLRHEYYPTTFEEIAGGYVITCSAFAENTNTCSAASTTVFVNPKATLPDFSDVEGSIELVDVRTDSSGETSVVLQSEKQDRLYVNRVT